MWGEWWCMVVCSSFTGCEHFTVSVSLVLGIITKDNVVHKYEWTESCVVCYFYLSSVLHECECVWGEN